jgi:hypothetical protein
MRPIAAASLLAALVIALYRKVTRLWWTYDDAWTVHLIVDHPLRDSFFAPEMWPQKLFTPLVTTAFEAQLAAFGLEPSRWYVVHLVLLLAAALALYATLRLWLSVAASCTAAVLFLAGVPMCAVIAVLGGTHYLQAIALASLSVMAFARGRTWLSAALYLVAMLAKETVVPLLPLLWFLPGTRQRLRSTVPHALALLLYLAWRYAVLGTILGGYGWAIAPDEWPRLLASLPQKIVLACAGANVSIGIAMLLVTAIGVAVAARRNVLLLLVAFALAVGPIIPVSKEMQRRYALMPWLVWSIAFVAGADRLKRGKPALLIAAGAMVLVANRQEWSQEFGRTQRMSDEASFFFHMPPDGVLRNPTVPPAAMGELVWLQSYAGRPTGASWFFDDYFLCTGAANGKRVWEYVPSRREVLPIATPPCPAYRRDAPLTWQFRYRGGSLFWKLGPYEEGRYRVLIGDGLQAFDVPRQEAFRLPDVPGLTVRLRYDSPARWTTYSPPIELRFR